jgi:replicative DNA helicase
VSLIAEASEKALVARLLIEPEDIGEIDGLTAEDFGLPRVREIFESIMKRHEEGKSFDAVTVAEDTGEEVDIMSLTPASFGPVKEYADAIKDAAVRRRLVGILDVARSEIAAGAGDPVATVSGAIDRIATARGVSGLRTSADVITGYREEVTRRHGGAGRTGIPYGIEALDRALLPLKPGRLVIFASRPGVGKTALAESVSDNAAKYGPVLFVSLEMEAEQLTDRAMARQSGLSARSIMGGAVDITELDDHLKARADLPLVYMDEGMTTTGDILSAATRMKMMYGGLGLVIVDYLQLVADKGENEVYRVGNISHFLKRMALKLKVPVLAMAQLNRAITMEGRAPRLSDLRDSGAIEQDADVVVVITGDPMFKERDLWILKQRQGQPGRLALDFDGDTQRWSERDAETW